MARTPPKAGTKATAEQKIHYRKSKDAVNMKISRKYAMPTAATRIIKDFDSKRTLATVGTPVKARAPATARTPPTAVTPATIDAAATAARYANSRWNAYDSS
jgi:hypothetical protein